jgi:hypothetical protein
VLEAERIALEGGILREAAEETATRSEAVPGDPVDITDPAHERAAAVAPPAWAPEAAVVVGEAVGAGKP